MTQTFPSIYPVACHTDHIGIGSIFVAIKGMHNDGTSYITLALQKGATKIVIDQSVTLADDLSALINKQAELVRVPNTRQALALMSAKALNFPANKLKIIGITGTKGKTTTSFLVEHLLLAAGHKTALLTSVYNKIDTTILKTGMTTPHPDYLHVFFNECVKAGVEYVVMEVAAQALSLHRTDGIVFDGVIFTNFDMEHAEFYNSLEEYFAAKCLIFKQVKNGAPQLINADDVWCKELMRKLDNLTSFGFNTKSAMIPAYVQLYNHDITVQIGTDHFKCSALIGEFNAYNLLAAITLAKQLGLTTDQIQQGLDSFTGVPGRLQMYPLPNGARCFIDKAHNPSSYRAVLGVLRGLTEHLIVVFGAGGDRDKTKRPLMGIIAAQLCDIVIITTDDPRSEDPKAIMSDIFAGIPEQLQHKVLKEVDREKAIRKAYALAKPNSIIALLGKGTDEYQVVGNKKIYFSECKIIQLLN
jgi:UDP-N-acetylmuramoyl-L-alanyl-D-glutamate--2,6-diaminopimelate ligase